mmetsp:Transcript_17496/g.41859  ORF Transcript_17496/g.41859 Transcript_17496/m.41859 type:complete len:127 (+) Transcript_17496:2793-3173(+)
MVKYACPPVLLGLLVVGIITDAKAGGYEGYPRWLQAVSSLLLVAILMAFVGGCPENYPLLPPGDYHYGRPLLLPLIALEARSSCAVNLFLPSWWEMAAEDYKYAESNSTDSNEELEAKDLKEPAVV